jgi:hypothetical protein
MKIDYFSVTRFSLALILMASPVLMGAQTLAVRAGARVTYVSGAASVKKGQLLKPGQHVTTGNSARVELTFSDGSRLRVGPASHMILVQDQPAQKHTLIHLNRGRVWNQVRPAPGKKVMLRTRHAVAAVLGTTYSVNCEQKQTRTAVIKGAVGVHLPFAENDLPVEHIFERVPLLSDKPSVSDTSVQDAPFQAPHQIQSPIHEVPSPVKVVPGPRSVGLNEWLQLVENQEITLGAEGQAEVRMIDPVQQQKQDVWFQWNAQMDMQPVRME